jgi:transglutaminase-like putative cysteine protease
LSGPGNGNGGPWRMRIRHRTGFRYQGEVVASYNEARMTPITDPAQTTLEARVQVSPTATLFRYWDYWGSYVTAFDVHSRHRELAVEATSVVETSPQPRVAPPTDWAVLRAEAFRDSHLEWLNPTPQTAVDAELTELAHQAAGGAAPAEAARAVADWLRAEMEYVPGATGVHTRGQEAWAERKGVCQDLAHLTAGAVRSLGIPARYVSGYLHPVAGAEVGHTVVGQSHAWVEWWDGEWTPYDPTHGREVGVEHVVVARGRDYRDVPPHKGIYAGPPATALGVTVEITRLA